MYERSVGSVISSLRGSFCAAMYEQSVRLQYRKSPSRIDRRISTAASEFHTASADGAVSTLPIANGTHAGQQHANASPLNPVESCVNGMWQNLSLRSKFIPSSVPSS